MLGYNYGYNVNPSPQGGQGAFGKVPGPIGVPPSQWQQALQSVPGLGGNANTASSAIQSMLQGQLSPDTVSQIEEQAAARGVSSGVPGSPFNTADLIRSLGLNSEALTQAGLGAFGSLAGTIGGLQESPALMADIAERNATLSAAPDPLSAFNEMENLFQRGIGLGTPSGNHGGYGSTSILGPRTPGPSYPSANSSPGLPAGSPDSSVLTGGPGFTESPAGSTTANSWQDYLNRTFGYSLGNPAGDTGTTMGDPLGDWATQYAAGNTSAEIPGLAY